MKNYLVFAGRGFYPNGGFQDFKEDFDSVEECKTFIDTLVIDWAHVVSLSDKSIVYKYDVD